jgi:hypothetical protein
MAEQRGRNRPGVRTQSTRDHETIRQWAVLHQAEPATGAETESGPATVTVNDDAPAVRFNFPGAARFRPIGWDEWLTYFDRHQLLFVYDEPDERQIAIRAHQLFELGGCQHGHDRRDWLRAEQELRRDAGGGSPSIRYRIVRSPLG